MRVSFAGIAYAPLDTSRTHARTLAEALEGSFAGLVPYLGLPALENACVAGGANDEPLTPDAQTAILCSDGGDATALPVSHWADNVRFLKSQSETLGAFWAQLTFACAGWTSKARWRFTGSYKSPPANASGYNSQGDAVPEAPMLLLSARYDPVTPLRNAWFVSQGHPGSAVVVQESVGHCAVGAWSECTNEIVREYLDTGKVPKNGTVCESKCKPWREAECDAPVFAAEAADGWWAQRFVPQWPFRRPSLA